MTLFGIASVCFSLGALIAVGMVCLCGGYILAVSVLDRFSKTVAGTHIRHAFVRMAPRKRFDENDQTYILNAVRRLAAEGRLKI